MKKYKPDVLLCIVFAAFLAAVACGPGNAPSQGAQGPATMQPVRLSISGPSEQLDMPPAADGWSGFLASQNEQLEALSGIMKGYENVILLFEPPAGGAKDEHAVLSFLRLISPRTKVLARGNGVLETLMREKGELPVRRSWKFSGSTDILGRPVILPKNHPLNTDWLDNPTRMAGADAVAVIHYIKRDADLEKLLRRRKEKDCSQILKPLEAWHMDAVAYFSGLTAQVNEALAGRFNQRVNARMDEWRKSLGEGGGDLDRWSTAAERSAARCRGANKKYLDDLAACIKSAGCDMLPQMTLVDGVQIAMVDDADMLIAPECTKAGSNIAGRVHAEAAAAALDTVVSIPVEWNRELAKIHRYYGLRALALRLCRPDRGVKTASSGQALADIINGYESTAGSEVADSGWIRSEGRVRIPGRGPAVSLARLDTADAAFEQWAENAEKAARSDIECHPRDSSFVGILIIDAGSSRVTYSQIFYPEEIMCIRDVE